jgi:hypothetical protein
MKDFDQPILPAPHIYVDAESLFVKGSFGYYLPSAEGSFLASLSIGYRLTLLIEKRLIPRGYPIERTIFETHIIPRKQFGEAIKKQGYPLIIFDDMANHPGVDTRYIIPCTYNTAAFDRLYAQFERTILGDTDEFRSRNIIRSSERTVRKSASTGFGAKF